MGHRRNWWIVATIVAACALLFAVPVASAEPVVSVGFAPTNPTFDQPVTVSFTGTTYAPERLYAYYYSGYRSYSVCSGADPRYQGTTPNLLDGVPVTGFFSIPVVVTFRSEDDISNGLYGVCVWLSGPGPETAVGALQKIGIELRRQPVPKPIDTWLWSSFRLRAEGRALVVTSQMVAFSGDPPRGNCVLEVSSGGTWLYATPQAPVDGRGRCRLSIKAPHLRRRYRVRFVPAVGFKASIGAPAWIKAATRPSA